MLEKKGDNWKKKLPILYASLYFLAIGFDRFYFNWVFAIKPFVMVTAIGIIVTLFIIKKMKPLLDFEKWMIIFYMMYMIASIRPGNLSNGIRYVCGSLMVLGFYICVRIALENITINQLEQIISIVGIVISSVSLFAYAIGVFLLNSYLGWQGRVRSIGVLVEAGIPRLCGIMNKDPNITAMMLIIFVFYYLYHLNNKINYVGAILSSLCILLTFSKGALIAFVMAWGITRVVPYYERKPIWFKKVYIVVPIIAFITLILLKDNGVDVLGIIKKRFIMMFRDNGAGRFILWEYGIQGWVSSPIFGIGGNMTKSYILEMYGVEKVLHNSWLEILLETGVMGAIPCVCFLYTTYSACKECVLRYKNRFVLVSFLAVVIMMCSISVQFNEGFYLLLAVVFAYTSNDKERNKDGKCNIY